LFYRYGSNVTDMDAIQKSAPAATPAADSNGSNAARKKRDRFNGMSEDEVLKLTIPDQLCHNLDILIVSVTSVNINSCFSVGLCPFYMSLLGYGNSLWLL
jgi:hypothetical protein